MLVTSFSFGPSPIKKSGVHVNLSILRSFGLARLAPKSSGLPWTHISFNNGHFWTSRLSRSLFIRRDGISRYWSFGQLDRISLTSLINISPFGPLPQYSSEIFGILCYIIWMSSGRSHVFCYFWGMIALIVGHWKQLRKSRWDSWGFYEFISVKWRKTWRNAYKYNDNLYELIISLQIYFD